MSISLIASPGGLFNRCGRILFGIKSGNLYLGSTDISSGGLKATGVTTTDILAQFLSTLQKVPDGITQQLANVRQTLDGWKIQLAEYVRNTVLNMANDDVTLVSFDVTTALKELIKQMIGSGTLYAADNDVDASTVSATVTALSANTGTGVLVCSVVRPDGRQNELVLAETIEAQCTQDSQSGGTARQETFSVRGEPLVSDSLGYNWPGGSSAAATLTAIDTDQNASGTLLYGGNFDTFTVANTPDYFGAALVGVYGTDILSEASIVLRTSGKSLRFKGDAATLSSIAQKFNVTTPATGTSGTSSVLKASTVYAVNCWMRKSASAVAGAVQLRLLDQGSPSVVNDDAGTANTITTAVGALSSAAWTAVSGFFRTPKVLPATGLQLNVRVSTAITNLESIYVDDLAMCEATQLYSGGVYGALFAGATAFILNDFISVAVANNRAGDFQEWFDRVFDMRSLGLQLPSDTGATETVLDSLIG